MPRYCPETRALAWDDLQKTVWNDWQRGGITCVIVGDSAGMRSTVWSGRLLDIALEKTVPDMPRCEALNCGSGKCLGDGHGATALGMRMQEERSLRVDLARVHENRMPLSMEIRAW